ncbi:MAG: hypothetical protein COV01_01270, partial [Candidatus Taylorbacteria bacterium CG10_big_fil_rev_8_21_14_0_10_41_48]
MHIRHYGNSEVAGSTGFNAFLGSIVDDVLTLGHYNASSVRQDVLNITEAGNVGIGTTAPVSLLTLAATQAGSDDTVISTLTFKNLAGVTGANTGEAKITALRDSDKDATKLTFSTADTIGVLNEAMRIDETGNVGIGTTTPATKLHIDSNTTGNQFTLARTGTHAGLSWETLISDFTGGGADLIWDTTGANTGFGFRTRDSGGTQQTALVLAPSGNVGIGTTNPQERLHISGGDVSDLLLDNQADLKWKDSTGTIRNVLTLHNNDNIYFDSIPG